MIRAALIACAALAFALTATLPARATGTSTEVIEPEHRLAQELVPVIEPMLGEEESVQAFDGKLILHARSGTFAEVKALLRRIDRAPAMLVVTLHLGRRAHQVIDDTSGSVRIQGGNDASAEGRVRVRETHSDADREVTKRVRVAEGRTASMRIGAAIPVPEQTVSSGPGGTVVQGGVRYRDVTVGLQVRPRLVDDRVHVEVRARDERLDDLGTGQIDTQDVATTVSGALGEWMLVGGIADTAAERNREILSTRRERFDASRRIWLKVDRIDQ